MTEYIDIKKEMQEYKEPPIPVIYKARGDFYANRDHPYWKDKEGNPYLPLNSEGNMRKGLVG